MGKELTTDTDYIQWLGEIKSRILHSQQSAALKVNQELLDLYWFIGEALLQKKSDWGDKFIENLARDLKMEFPAVKGFSKRNLEYMRRWYSFYSSHLEFAQQLVAQIEIDYEHQKAQQLVAQISQKNPFPLLYNIPWGHHLLILTKTNTPEEAWFYVTKTIQNGWSRNVLQEQMQAGLYERQGKALTNFKLTLPGSQADLAKETLKNPYNFDFLTLEEDVKERDFEKALIQHIKQFLLELGKGFAYVGNQYNLNVEGDDFFLDLLFFNINLNCYVVFELKVGDFKPEYAGKLNMYVNAVNEQIKHNNHSETIGVLLCKTPNKTVIEYSIKGIANPLGVSEYTIKTALPEELRKNMPTVKELEDELENEAQKKGPLDEKREKLLALINSSSKEEVRISKSPEVVKQMIENVFLPLCNKIDETLIKQHVKDWYVKTQVSYRVDSFFRKDIQEFFLLLKEHPVPDKIELEIYFDGFRKAGTNAFDNFLRCYLQLSDFKYTIGHDRNDTNKRERLYSHEMTNEELIEIAEESVAKLMDEIITQVERIQ